MKGFLTRTLAVLAGIVMGILAGILFGINAAIVKKAGDSTNELLPFELQMTGLAVISLFKIAVSPFAEGPRPRRLAFAPRSRMGAAYEPARPAARFRTAVKALRD